MLLVCVSKQQHILVMPSSGLQDLYQKTDVRGLQMHCLATPKSKDLIKPPFVKIQLHSSGKPAASGASSLLNLGH